MTAFHDNPTPYLRFVGQATDVDTPPTVGDWRLFFKDDGLYIIDDAGVVTFLGSAAAVLTTKGDLLGHDGSALARLGVGTDGQVLTADSAELLGIKWADAAAGGGGGGMGVVVTVASSEATADQIAAADYACDGTADEVEIEAAIADVVAAGGGTVLLSRGAFYLAASITGAADVNLIGEGWTTKITVANGTNNSFSLLDGTWTRSILADFQVDGNKANNASASGMGFFGSTPDGIMRNVWFHSNKGRGAYAGGDRAKIVNCKFTSNDVRGFETNSEYLWIVNCDFGSNGHSYGLYLDGADYARVIGCRAYSNTSDGIGGTSHHSTFVGNECYSNGGDGATVQGTNCTVVGNTFRQNTGDGIQFGSDHGACTGNAVWSNGQHGINGFTANDAVISGNAIEENGTGGNYDGIWLQSATRTLVTANTVRGVTNQRYGINVGTSDCTNCRVVGNDIYNGGATDDLNDAGTGTILTWPAHATYGDNFTT